MTHQMNFFSLKFYIDFMIKDQLSGQNWRSEINLSIDSSLWTSFRVKNQFLSNSGHFK